MKAFDLIFRLQDDNNPGTYIYVGADEKDQILRSFPEYTLEGIAFEAIFESPSVTM